MCITTQFPVVLEICEFYFLGQTSSYILSSAGTISQYEVIQPDANLPISRHGACDPPPSAAAAPPRWERRWDISCGDPSFSYKRLGSSLNLYHLDAAQFAATRSCCIDPYRKVLDKLQCVHQNYR